jgi:hypothetical protein
VDGLQARTLRLRRTQVGTVKAVTTTIEAAAWVLPVVTGRVADEAGVGAGLGTYAAIAWALALVVVAFTRRAP